MRSHAKAPTAGSNRQQAAKLALPASLFAALVALVVVVGNASAANGVVNFFGGEGTIGGKFVSASSGPGGIAVNQNGTGGATAGDVYVVDRGNRRVQQFEADGTWVRAFGKDVGGAGVDICEVAASCVAATASEAAGAMNNPQGIAIDQANGNVFVSDQTNRRIDVFSAEGAFQAAFGYGVDTGTAALELCTTASTCAAGASGANAGQFGAQIGYPAIAPAGSPNAGDLYVGNKSNRRVDQFEIELTGSEVTGVAFVKGWGWGVDDGAPEFQQCTTASVCQAPNTSSPTTNPGQFSSNQPQAIAIDSAGNAYTAESAGNSRAQKFDASGNPAPFSGADLAGSPGPLDITVDPTTDHVFGLKEPSGAGEKRVIELNAAGATVAAHASGTTITSANSVAVANGTTNFYVSTNQNVTYRGVFFLGTKVNPTASSEAPSPLESHSATLKGKVNPQGFTTSYQFEFSRDGGSSWEKLPASPVDLGNGEADVPVEQEVTGLIGDSSYQYKIVATKPFGAGSATSNTTFFAAPASAPTIPATYSSAVTTKTAVLNAEINPNNQATTYHFEYGTADCTSNPCTSVPVPDAGVGSGSAAAAVFDEIADLQPDTTYHFRAVATSPAGATQGPDTTFHTFPDPTPSMDCPNSDRRLGPAANLPDCRAYEMVSPINKNGADIGGATTPSTGLRGYFEQSAPSGDKLTFTSPGSFADQVSATNANQYIASRTNSGWLTDGVNPPKTTSIFFALNQNYEVDNPFEAFSDDLSSAWVKSGNASPITSTGIPDFGNLYRRDNLADSYQALTVATPTSAAEEGAMNLEFRGASADGTHQVFEARGALTPNAASTTNRQIYDYSEGALHLVSVLPDGTAAPNQSYVGTLDGSYSASSSARNSREVSLQSAVSNSGERVFFSNNTTGAPGVRSLYVREHPSEPQSNLNVSEECTEPVKACTYPISQTVTAGDAQFWAASDDGKTILFSTLSGSTPGNLYEFDVDTKTPMLVASQSAGVLGTSDDLSHIYFTSADVLAAGASSGAQNVYLKRNSEVLFVATLTGPDVTHGLFSVSSAVSLSPRYRSTRVTPDGRHLVFTSSSTTLSDEVAGYDNIDARTGEADREVFLYDAGEGVTCVSCNPSGARPNGQQLPVPYFFPNAPTSSEGRTNAPAAAWIPTWGHAHYASRVISDDGSRVFFNSFDALVAHDVNGEQDVYVWQAPFTGKCTRVRGCVDLLSTGTSSKGSEFVDASADGRDVFIYTTSSIDPRDPGLIDIYDARENGGFDLPPAPPDCVGDACQAVPPAPRDPTAASASFKGAGNPAPAAHSNCRGQARRARAIARRGQRFLRRSKHKAVPKPTRRALRKRAVRLSARAQRLRKSAQRCRRANRRAQR